MNFMDIWPYFAAIAVAAGLDIVANLFLAKSEGFKRLGYGLSAILLVALAFTCLAFAVRKMDLAVAYAMWGSFGILGTSLGGWLFFSQKLRPCAFAGMALLMTGMALLHMS